MSGIELAVLGTSGTFPVPGNPATGFLVSGKTTRVWVDAGAGTFANLQTHCDYKALDAVVLSHLHLDHVLDLFSLYYALRYARDTAGPQGLKVLAPEGSKTHLESLIATPGGFAGFFEFVDLQADAPVTLGEIDFEFHQAVHPVPTFALRASCENKTLGYTADTGPSETLDGFFKGVDLLVAEASFQQPVKGMEKVHMTASQAGSMAAVAGAGRLALTHLVPGLDPKQSVKLAGQSFEGEVTAPAGGQVLDV